MSDNPPPDYRKIDREIFEIINKLRANPPSLIPHLKKVLSKYDGKLLKRIGKPDLMTKEGA